MSMEESDEELHDREAAADDEADAMDVDDEFEGWFIFHENANLALPHDLPFTHLIDIDEEEMDDELGLPSELSSLTVSEKQNLLRFKRSHNQVRLMLTVCDQPKIFFVLIKCTA